MFLFENIDLGSVYFLFFIRVKASMAQLAERSAVNRQVLGSIPSGGVFFSILFFTI